MRTPKYLFLGFLMILFSQMTSAQTTRILSADSILDVQGEIYFKFLLGPEVRLDTLTRIISIDNVSHGVVWAYANRDEYPKFLNFNIKHTVLPSPGTLLTDAELNMGNIQRNSDNMTIWNFFPTYAQYLTFMSGWASTYPAICKLDTIGISARGHLLLALKISDSVNYDRGAPQVFMTSSIHGDETTGYIMMMHLIDSLLNGYGTVTRITNLVNKTQIFINPLANPDGTYYASDNTVVGSIRGNGNRIDMNRNYPDPRAGQHPDGYMWQPETMAMMEYSDRHRFSMSMNFHGGAEVVNYPWDTWNSSQKITADDSWWQWVSHEYADSAQFYGPPGYFTGVTASGVSNGGDWYIITGGRQDFHNYFRHDREVTLEISLTKNVAASTLLGFWNYNKRSLLNYIEQASYGINGKVYDSITYAPIGAKVFVNSHDVDSSWIYSALPSGWYFRNIDNGTWSITYSAPGYYPRTVSSLTSTRYAVNRQNIKLRPIDQYWPRCFQATAVTSHQIDLRWLKDAANDPVMIAVNTSNSFGTPASGTAYTADDVLSGGGVIIYVGSATAYSHLWLNPGTTYYYRAWSVRSGNIYSNPAAASATTYCGSANNLPLIESFTTATAQLPTCWTQEITGNSANYATYSWRRTNTVTAGGTAWEMRGDSVRNNTVATARLKSPPFNTVGVSLLTLSFKRYIRGAGFGSGATLKVQSSADGVTWTDEGWSFTTNNTDVAAGTVTINIVNNLNSPSTRIAFVMTGDLTKYSYWTIDDVTLKAPGFWIGGTMTAPKDWNTATNWGDGAVPTAATNAYIPMRPYLPVVSNDPASPAQCLDLTIEKDAKVTVIPAKKLIVNGNLLLKSP
jgi:hypothetical protein